MTIIDLSSSGENESLQEKTLSDELQVFDSQGTYYDDCGGELLYYRWVGGEVDKIGYYTRSHGYQGPMFTVKEDVRRDETGRSVYDEPYIYRKAQHLKDCEWCWLSYGYEPHHRTGDRIPPHDIVPFEPVRFI